MTIKVMGQFQLAAWYTNSGAWGNEQATSSCVLPVTLRFNFDRCPQRFRHAVKSWPLPCPSARCVPSSARIQGASQPVPAYWSGNSEPLANQDVASNLNHLKQTVEIFSPNFLEGRSPLD